MPNGVSNTIARDSNQDHIKKGIVREISPFQGQVLVFARFGQFLLEKWGFCG